MKKLPGKILAGVLAAVMAAGMLAALGGLKTQAAPDLNDPGEGYELNYNLVDKISIVPYSGPEEMIPETGVVNFGVNLRINIKTACISFFFQLRCVWLIITCMLYCNYI